MDAAATLLEVHEHTTRFSIRLGDLPRQAATLRRAQRLELAATINDAVQSLIARYFTGEKVAPENSICSELDDFDQSAAAETAGGIFIATRSGTIIFCHFTPLRKGDGDGSGDDPAGPDGGKHYDLVEIEFLENVSFLLLKDTSTGFSYRHIVINFVNENDDDYMILRLVDGSHRHPICAQAASLEDVASLFGEAAAARLTDAKEEKSSEPVDVDYTGLSHVFQLNRLSSAIVLQLGKSATQSINFDDDGSSRFKPESAEVEEDSEA